MTFKGLHVVPIDLEGREAYGGPAAARSIKRKVARILSALGVEDAEAALEEAFQLDYMWSDYNSTRPEKLPVFEEVGSRKIF